MSRPSAALVLLAATSTFACSPLRMTLGPGTEHTCATTNDRVASCWGRDVDGQLGDGTAGGERAAPAPVTGLGLVAALASGAAHSCAIADDRTVHCWGSNADGQLGHGHITASSATPVQVGWPPRIPPPPQSILSNVTSIAAGDAHTCAAIDSGEVWCWGSDANGELGNPLIGGTAYSPVRVPDLHVGGVGPSPTRQVAAAGQLTCALLFDGTVWCWGLNNRGQLGRGFTSNSELPAPVPFLAGVSALAVGHDQACAITAGQVRCWGDNLAGFSSTSPTLINGLPSAYAVAVGASHACAASSGALHCWGGNYYGQLGDGTRDDRLAPVLVPGVTGAAKLAASHYATCAAQRDATLWCWGFNAYGQLGQPNTTDVISSPVLVPL